MRVGLFEAPIIATDAGRNTVSSEYTMGRDSVVKREGF